MYLCGRGAGWEGQWGVGVRQTVAVPQWRVVCVGNLGTNLTALYLGLLI